MLGSLVRGGQFWPEPVAYQLRWARSFERSPIMFGCIVPCGADQGKLTLGSITWDGVGCPCALLPTPGTSESPDSLSITPLPPGKAFAKLSWDGIESSEEGCAQTCVRHGVSKLLVRVPRVHSSTTLTPLTHRQKRTLFCLSVCGGNHPSRTQSLSRFSPRFYMGI